MAISTSLERDADRWIETLDALAESLPFRDCNTLLTDDLCRRAPFRDLGEKNSRPE